MRHMVTQSLIVQIILLNKYVKNFKVTLLFFLENKTYVYFVLCFNILHLVSSGRLKWVAFSFLMQANYKQTKAFGQHKCIILYQIRDFCGLSCKLSMVEHLLRHVCTSSCPHSTSEALDGICTAPAIERSTSGAQTQPVIREDGTGMLFKR